MAKVKLYIDEDLTHRLAQVLRGRGYDVVSVHEVGMEGKSDEEQLDYSTRKGRVILTRNTRHFVQLQRTYFRSGKQHAGILVTDDISFAEMLRRLKIFLETVDSEYMRNFLDWLPNYKKSS